VTSRRRWRIGDGMGLPTHFSESNSAILDPMCQEFSSHVCRLEENLIVALDINRLLEIHRGCTLT